MSIAALGLALVLGLGLELAHWLEFNVWTAEDQAKVFGALAPLVMTVLVFFALFGVPSLLLLHAAQHRKGAAEAAARGNDTVVTSALARDHEAVYRKGRARIDVTFKIQMGVLVLLALVLLAGLGGAIAASLAGQIGVAAGSGGASVLGLVSSIVLKPNAEIRKAVADVRPPRPHARGVPNPAPPVRWHRGLARAV